jgi:hypothetical protein
VKLDFSPTGKTADRWHSKKRELRKLPEPKKQEMEDREN